MLVQQILVRVVAACSRRAWLVLLLGLLLAAGAVGAAATRLGVETDTSRLFSRSLPWKQREAELDRDFPQFTDLLVAVIDGKSPEERDATAEALARGLSADKQHFRTVRRPDALPFFQQEGFLFLDKPELETLLNQTIDAQPFLGQLVGDPSMRGLFAALSLVAMGVEQGQAELGPFAPALRAFHETLAAAAAGHAEPLSWQRLLGGGLSDKAGPFDFVLSQPRQDYTSLQPGGAATAALRAIAADIPYVKEGRARVRVTGSVALSDEEFSTALRGAVEGTAGSIVLVAVWLFLAVRSWRMIVPILLTLFLGLFLTTGFAALAVGTLNLISLAFAILFVGIAVDFAIQFAVRFREARLHAPAIGEALGQTARRAGVQVLVAAAATAAGFLAFVPTSFTGVAELGLIAGGGMVIAFLCTVTFLPAMLTLFRPRPETAEIGFRWARPLDAAVARLHWPLLLLFALIAAAGAFATPRLVFDSDPLHTKDPTTEAMRTLTDMMDSPLSNPYSVDLLEPDVTRAAEVASRLRPLSLVAQVVTLTSFVPEDQQEKLALIADANSVLSATLAPRSPAAPVTPADLRLATKTALTGLDRALPRLPKDHPLAAIAGDLRALQGAPDSVLLAANDALTRFLPMQLDRLRTALTAQPVTLDSLPADVARDWRLPDGRTRVQAVARPGARDSEGLHALVAQVASVAPEVGGSAVTITATADTIISAFRAAVLGALAGIAVILFLALRRPLDVALVLAPLLLSGLMTAALCYALPLPLNFANIIALPLLLGVGVSFNIYFVMNWRAGQTHPLGSATARAVVFSALTTATAFGSLALSAHPGTASMGELLLLSLGCTLVASLVFVPSVLAALPRPRPDATRA